MTAIVQARYGDDPAAVLSPGQVPVPRPRPGQVLVRVEAAGVDRGVWHLTTGRPYAARLGIGLTKPRQPVPGLDFAGTVAAVGEGVSDYAVGDPVFGSGTGAYAGYATAPASRVIRRPQHLSPVEAAALPVSGCTALQAVRDHARVAAGNRVLIIGASGGVGSYAVQLAASAGAEVTAVARGTNREFVLGLGAKDVIDYTREEIDARGGGYDVVIDIAGNRPLRLLRSVLAARGRLVIVGGENGGPLLGGLGRQLRGSLLTPFISQHLGGMFGRTTGRDLAALAQAAETGTLRPMVSMTYALADAGKALADLADGRIRGKAVITVGEPGS
ncbi:NAD(P)-dependent alcohol dehydrogenase [Arthrobacter sp. PM3]|nr:NAD(P)-dependent alcohol dehydrogenase [Arthrobacter sp. PM3]